MTPRTLYCWKCEQHKPDKAFTQNKNLHTRRFRDNVCRECKAIRYLERSHPATKSPTCSDPSYKPFGWLERQPK